VQWRLLAPFAILLGLTLVGLTLGMVSDRFAFYDAGDGKAVVLFWTVYNAAVLALCVLAGVELPRREAHVADRPERAILAVEGEAPRRVWLASLAMDEARVRGRALAPGTRAVLRVIGLGDIDATVLDPEAEATQDGARLMLTPSPEVRAAMMRRLYAEGGAPGVLAVRPGAFIEDLARRMSAGPGA